MAHKDFIVGANAKHLKRQGEIVLASVVAGNEHKGLIFFYGAVSTVESL